MRTTWRMLAFGAVWAAVAVRAEPPQFQGEESLSALRIFMPAMRGAVQVPDKPVQVFQYAVRQGDRTWREERSPAEELWRGAQTSGTWVDRSGNELSLARIAFKLPPAVADLDVSPDAFAEMLSEPEQRLGEDATGSELSVWMSHYLGAPLAGPPEGVPMGRTPLSAVAFPTGDPRVLAYAVAFDPSQPGQERAPRGWIAFVLRLADEPERGAAERFEQDFLRRVRAAGRFAADGGAKSRSRARPADAAAPVPQDARRIRAWASIELLDDWWHMDSSHYVVLCDAPSGTAEADRLLSDLEALRPHYEALAPRFTQRDPETSIVRLFRSDEEFVRYLTSSGVALGGDLTAGFFDPQRQELVVRPASRRTAADPASTLRHEGFHQYLDEAWDRIEASPWFNEGTATLFECYEPNGGRFEFRELRRHGQFLEKLARDRNVDWTPLLRALLLWDYRAFYNPPVAGADPSLSYSLAYGLMYFLHRGAPQMRGRPYADVLPDYARTLCETRSPLRATLEAFRMGDDGRDERFVKRLADDLRAFWRNDSARRDARSAPIP